ncbi:hypothetical protein HUU05_16140 [candidate division KSB1 bacterium]|nr:hypothetical protein [candidate division KSB1 bacterium]
MQKKWRLLIPGAVLLLFALGCGSGELPTAVEQPQQLYAPFLKSAQDIPVLDGRADDKAWQSAPVYRVFLDNKNGGLGLPAQGILVNLQAVWWKVIVDTTHVDSTRIDTTFASYIGIHASWPDPDKSLAHEPWSFNPADATWSQGTQGSDWLLLVWTSFADDTDLWYWDAATTNPMGYFQDMVLEGYDTGNDIEPLFVRVDGLNFFNDTPTAQNTWDPNHDNNNTPSSSDDRPKFAWKNDPSTTPPGLPPVYSSADENRQFLLESEAVSLATSAYANPTSAVTVPSVLLQEPSGGSADIRCYGRHENGKWTLEFARIAKASDNSDVVFNPSTRFFSQSFSMALGNNTAGAFDGDLAKITVNNIVYLTFEFRR